MDGAADSDHSMTWEDFFGSTSDLTPTLIGIYDSLLEPGKPQSNKPQTKEPQGSSKQTFRLESSHLHGGSKAITTQEAIKENLGSKDARTDPPNLEIVEPKIAGGLRFPGHASVNKSSLYTRRTNVIESDSVNDGASVKVSADSSFLHSVDKMKDQRRLEGTTGFDTLSPNVKRMISSASDTTTSNFLKHHNKKQFNVRASIRGHKSNIPLVGTTSKISQSGVELLDSVEIYDQPTLMKGRNQSEERLQESPVKSTPIRTEFRIDAEAPATYDVPTNLQSIYDVPSANTKTAFESLSLPYIDQSIELTISSNDREFDIKLNSKDTSPEQPPKTSTPENSPYKKIHGTNSLNRKDVQAPSKQLQKSGPYPDAIGSTGNLKLCTVPEKENRLLPPTVEVSRPLSMSSIASSSSTSSSGVQNKGGVNSAYLASIESLDDHSDADMVSANGSNNFVNSTGMLNAGNSENLHSQMNRGEECGERAGLSQLELVCAEIVETENVYVEDLRQVVEGYLHVWRESKTFSSEELAELFNNIEDIYAFNRSLCEQLNTCQLDPTSLARQFVDNTAGFSVYTRYCTGYPQTMSRLAALASCPVGTRACRERQTYLNHALPLGSYLLKPVQRILKYRLLLQNLVKQCPSRHTEYALLKMTDIAQHINDMKRRHEHAVRVQEIQSLLYGWSGPDLTTYGELCAEGTFRVFGAKAMRHAFLFDKMLLLTKNREDGILAYKSHIMCNNLMLVESIAGAPLSFHVIPWDAPRAQLTLQARSQRHKREWTLLLKRVILENYNAVIPSHARQLVMELGQNKTDDDMLAEKSHNLITHASMRKQLSAPEYLEKRKLERERRKTCENRVKKTNTETQTNDTREPCDCAQVSAEKGTDYTCENCYVDLCSDCEVELSKDKNECSCKNDVNADKCPECDRSLQYIDAGSVEQLERKQSCCKCSDFKSSQESFGKEYSTINITRGYHSSDNIVSYTEKKEDSEVKAMQKTCLKCAKIKENIAITNARAGTIHRRKSRCTELEKLRSDTLRSKSKDDPQRSKLSKISTWRRKSEPGLENNAIASIVSKKTNESERPIDVPKGYEKIEFECRNCGSTKVTRKKGKHEKTGTDSDQGSNVKGTLGTDAKPNIEVRMYNTKHVPKKISKLRKSRAKGVRLGSDVTAKFYADFSTDVSTENILHISESTDSINTITKEEKESQLNEGLAKHDPDIDEETYRKLLEKTDSFKKNELEKVKYLNQQKVISEGAECESDKQSEPEKRHKDEESGEESEKPLEHIISQLLMQNREFQKILKKQQLRNGAQRRHQRLLKSHSNPEQAPVTKNKEQHKVRPKYGRQTSENIKLNETEISRLSPQKELDNGSDDDHIYETLRVQPKIEVEEIQVLPKSRSPSPPKNLAKLTTGVNSRLNVMESDYVYLSFDKVKPPIEDDSIYDVPSSIPVRVQKPVQSDYYVAVNKKINDNIYDQVDACRRDSDNLNTSSGDYLPMNKDQQKPNAPEIWLSRQKEHFTVSRDRKSGSLPRSFQVPSAQDETSLSTFKSKPNGSNKTYLNRDGKVLSIDRPFTIASDKSEISYDDVETYMNDDDILKYNKPMSNQNFYDGELENLSKSTLELEEEIDRCYKNNFEKKIEADSNRNLVTDSQQNIDISVNSSCEVLSPEKQSLDNVSNVNLVHPEHKIYKPTTNLLSLKNVLSRFKNKTPNKNSIDNETEVNANDQMIPDSKADLKSPTSNEKRSALNPRSYSKNLLQRFKNIIGDEHTDDPKNVPRKVSLEEENNQNKLITSDIKVVITSTDPSPTTSTIIASNVDLLSKSVCEQSTLSESQNEKNNLDALSRSCDNIKQPDNQCFRPIYDKSISMITSMPNSVNSSPSRSNHGSYQNFNKLPIYKQGSKHLGARIAQSDYVDPQTLLIGDSKTDLSNVNILINKNALRPDSLLSNSSFVTSSSEGTYQIEQNKTFVEKVEDKEPESTGNSIKRQSSLRSSVVVQSDESFYEKSFEKIESIIDQDLFRDSAVYSDQEDSDDMKLEVTKSLKTPLKNASRLETVKRNTSIKSEYNSLKKIATKSNVQTVSTITTLRNVNKSAILSTPSQSEKQKDMTKQKVAPPVPVKPKIITPALNKSSLYPKSINKPIGTFQNESAISVESSSSKNIKRNSGTAKSIVRTDSIISSESLSIESTKVESSKSDSVNPEALSGSESVKSSKVIVHVSSVQSVEKNTDSSRSETSISRRPASDSLSRTASHSIQMKRLSFERTSLDSATRKSRNPSDVKRTSAEIPKMVSKSVLERRLEIESMAKGPMAKHTTKPKQIVPPKSITSKMASYERSISEESHTAERAITRRELRSKSSIEESNIPKPGPVLKESRSVDETDRDESIDARESWVKTIVNKFQ